MQILTQLGQILEQTVREQVIKPAVIDQGYVWVEEFKKAFPVFSFFVNTLRDSTAESVLDSLVAFNPKLQYLQRNPLALAAIRQLQTKLKAKG